MTGNAPYLHAFKADDDRAFLIYYEAKDGQLTTSSLTRAQFLGHSEIVLETRIELTENHATFAHMGFVKTREGAHDGYDHPTYIEMRKAL